MHFEYISEAVAQGLMQLNLRQEKLSPVVYGVLECLTEEQALARAGLIPCSHNHGTEWAQSALRMAEVFNTPPVVSLAQYLAAAGK